MMQNHTLWEQFEDLSPSAQRQVAEFIAELSARSKRENAPRRPIVQETFVGMWRDREDLADSSGWVRRIRAEEWGK